MNGNGLKIKMISHRGEEFSAPEGSRPAYQLAVERKADIMKLDVIFTRDNVPVLSHDTDFKRTMGWEVNGCDVTLQEIREKGVFLPVGGYAEERIVTLAEGLSIVKNTPEFWIDTKDFSPEKFELILMELRKAGISDDRIMVATFEKDSLDYVNRKHPGIRRIAHTSIRQQADGSFWTNYPPENCKDADEICRTLLAAKRSYGLFGCNLPHSVFTKGILPFSLVDELRKNGLWISLWFVNTEETARALKDHAADAYVTGRILEASTYCRK